MADWSKIKSDYIRGGVSYRKLAEKYGVSFSSISRKAISDNWTDLRKQREEKTSTKIVDSVASQEAKRVDMFQTISDKILKMISDGIDDGSIVVSGRGFRDITGALKDLREIKGLKSELDLQEQIARIEKLRKDAKEESADDKTIKVIIGDDTEEYSK